MSSGCVHPEPNRTRSAGFTLIELLVSMAVLVLILVLLASMSDQVMRTWKRSAAHAQSWQEGRVALELISRRITQATLNPHWAYDNVTQPTRYLRHSDLHFVIEPARQFFDSQPDGTIVDPQFDGKTVGPGSAVFFQAPLGVTTETDRRSLTGMLNTCGFFITRSTESSPVSATASSDRYRLMEVLAPAERMSVYRGTGKGWATSTAAAARPIAENIVLLVVRPMAGAAGGEPEPIGLKIAYDSTSGAAQSPQPSTANQLPPIVEITIVAIDEASAERFNTLTLPSTSPFLDVAQFEGDLQRFEDFLINSRIQYRILRNRVTLPNSTWNG